MDESLGGALLEEIEESKAFFEVYDGAVYLYQVIALLGECHLHMRGICEPHEALA